MNGSQQGRAATIHQFPEGGRSRGLVVGSSASTVVRPARFAPRIIAEGGWYHEEAMREEEAASEVCKPN